MNYEALSDNQLLGLYAETGEEAAFQAFYDRNNDELRGFLCIICKVAYRDIHDLLQVVWSKVATKAHLYDPKQGAILWLRTLAKNVKNDACRKTRTATHGGPNTLHYTLSDRRFEENLIADRRTGLTASDPSMRMVREEQRQQIHEAIEKLNPKQRQAIKMVILDGIPSSKAAESLGIARNLFSMRLSQGKRDLQRLLGSRKHEFVG